MMTGYSSPLSHYRPIAPLVVALGYIFFGARAEAHEVSGTLGDHQDFLQGCLTEYPRLPIDFSIDSATQVEDAEWTLAPSYHSSSGGEDCLDYAFVDVPLYGNLNHIWMEFGGPDIDSSAWDCNHSAVRYGVFVTDYSGVWELVAFGYTHGNLENGDCRYGRPGPLGFGSAFHYESPHSATGPLVTVYGGHGPAERHQFVGKARVMIYSWAHNDTNLAHPGNLCSSDNCYYGAWVTAVH